MGAGLLNPFLWRFNKHDRDSIFTATPNYWQSQGQSTDTSTYSNQEVFALVVGQGGVFPPSAENREKGHCLEKRRRIRLH